MTALYSFYKKKEIAFRSLFFTEDDRLNEAAKTALFDLRVFCHGTKSAFNNDPLEMARIVGRQEVYQHIMNYLNYDYSEQIKLEETNYE